MEWRSLFPESGFWGVLSKAKKTGKSLMQKGSKTALKSRKNSKFTEISASNFG
jgi:hypothetical protein